MPLNISRTRELLEGFDFRKLFVEELGWSNPVTRQSTASESNGFAFERRQIAHLAGVVVFEIDAPESSLPDAKTRAAISKEISKLHHENLLIFVDVSRTKSLWYWVKRDGAKTYPRDHLYVKGQPGDLFLSKLASIVVEISELDAKGNIPVSEVALRLKRALDVERVTKRFYREFQEQHVVFLEMIEGIEDERQRRWYASVLLNRLMFIYFLQRKYFLDGGNTRYLQEKLAQSRKQGRDRYYSSFLNALFFEGFAKPEKQRSPEARKLLGQIKFLNGGLFLPHYVEIENSKIHVPDKAFENLFALFERYSWNLDDTPGGNDDEINPDVLGYIFEKYVNRKDFGAYYTRPEITGYLCEQTIYKLVLDRINASVAPAARKFASMPEMLLNLDANLCRQLLHDVLPSLSLLDPACGSGAFLVAAMKTLINLYSAIVGKIDFLHDRPLTEWLATTRAEHPSLNYFIKKRIITDNLFGVDIMEEGAEIARLRLFLALVASAHSVEQLEPLPNIDFNVLAGNSLIGLLKVDPQRFDAMGEKQGGKQALMKLKHKGSGVELPEFAVESTVAPSRQEKVSAFVAERTAGKFAAILEDKNKSIALYRKHAFQPEQIDAIDQDVSLVQLRSHIDNVRADSYIKLNQLLLDEFNALGIQFEQATWDDTKNREGRPIKRSLALADIEALTPFHWGYEFDQIINERGGFDAIITNPPWQIFKPIAKEFCYDFDPEVERRGTEIKDFEERLGKLLKKSDVRKKYLEYVSQFPHLSAYFRGSAAYANQVSIIDGRKEGADINLYKLFSERCFNLARHEGYCGIVVPSGIYSDLGTRQLRQLLFDDSRITGLFCFENRKEIFEGVHRSFKFVVLTFEKGAKTQNFPTAFMRHDVEDLLHFPNKNSVRISVDLIKRLSPGAWSVMEFKNDLDMTIADKMAKFPRIGEWIEDRWNFKLTAEFHMTNDSRLFRRQPSNNRLPLYEGRMIWLFEHGIGDFRYWIDERQAIAKLRPARAKAVRKLLRNQGLAEDFDEEKLDLRYGQYRLGLRAVTGATNERALVVSIIPRRVFAGNSLLLTIPTSDAIENETWQQKPNYNGAQLLCCCALLGSYVCDWFIRLKILTNMNMFYVYEIPVPRLSEKDPQFAPIVTRAVKLICTTAEFDELAREAELGSHRNGVKDPAARAKLRAELDGLVAHLYGLTEDEFAYILSTFPLVAQPVKDAARAEFRALAPKPGDPEIAALLGAGENAKVEFKSSARWDLRENKKNPAMEQVVLKTVAAFLNSDGGTLLLGVSDDGAVLGLEHDYQTLQKKNADGYELFLGDLLLNHFGRDLSRNLKFSFHKVVGKQVCKVGVEAAPRAVWVKEGADEHLYIRAGNSTRRLTTKEAIDYCNTRWKA
jgi:hypothetical protein